MIEVGRVCLKIAGRDGNKKAVVVEIIDDNYVLIDGDVRRKKCNVSHLEPLETILRLKKGANHAEIAKLFKSELGIEISDKKPKKATERPKKIRGKAKTARLSEESKAKKKEIKKTANSAGKEEKLPEKEKETESKPAKEKINIC